MGTLRLRPRRWIDAEIDRLDPVGDASRIYHLTLNKLAVDHPIFLSLVYTHGFMRIAGQAEGAIAVDGAGKVHGAPYRRSDDTMRALAGWIQDTPGSDRGRQSLAKIRQIHDSYGRRFEMSHATFVHTVALFTLQTELMLKAVGAPQLSEKERLAQVVHWCAVGEALGVDGLPRTWTGMARALADYEASAHFRHTAVAGRLADAFVDDFAGRWFPRPLHPLARWIVLSLHDERTLEVLGTKPPPAPAAAAVRAIGRAAIFVRRRLLPDRRELIDLCRTIDDHYNVPGRFGSARSAPPPGARPREALGAVED